MLTVGILKEEKIDVPTIGRESVGIVDGGVSGLDERKYPPLIPLPKEHPEKGKHHWGLFLISREFEEWKTRCY
jgi:hypothetical protein